MRAHAKLGISAIVLCSMLSTVLPRSIYVPESIFDIDSYKLEIKELEEYRVSQFKDFLAQYMNVTIENVPISKDYCNNIYVYSKDQTFAKGDTFTDKSLAIVRAAEHVEIVLDKRGQPFVPLPDMIHSLKTIRSMYLKNVGVTEATKAMTCLENLEELEMHSCAIHDISSIIPLNSSLKKLILNDCDIQNCQIDPTRVPNLTELTITCCNLDEINKHLFMIKDLKKINLSNNHLYGLPKFEDSDVVTTVELDLSRNRLVEFPESLKKFSKLKKLNMKGNNIKKFKCGFPDENVLEEIILSYNRIKRVPKAILKLAKIKTLDFKHNQLEKIPPELFIIDSLEKLDLSFNKLKDIEEPLTWLVRNVFKAVSLKVLKNEALKELDISYNFLESIPESFNVFQHLEKLNLAGNEITSIPDILKYLERLKVVDLSFNKLTFIPEFFAGLERLEELKLCGGRNFRHPVFSNRIKAVPKAILDRFSKNMIKLDLKGNLLDTESSLFAYGSDDLKKYYGDWVVL